MAATLKAQCDNCKKEALLSEVGHGVLHSLPNSEVPDEWTITHEPAGYHTRDEYVFCCPNCVCEWQQTRIHDPRFTG